MWLLLRRFVPVRLVLREYAVAFAVLILYFVVCTAVLVSHEPGWTVIDSIYFSMATCSTVGYGDLSPSSSAMRVFTVVMIFLGIGGVYPLAAQVISRLFLPMTAKGRGLLDRAFPPVYIDIDEDGSKDFRVPERLPVFYLKNLLPSAILFMTVQVVSAAIYMALEPNWSFGDSLYHSIVTASTVGYGDTLPVTQGGRLFCAFHMLLAVSLLAELLTTVGTVREERAMAQQRVKVVEQELDEDLMERLNCEMLKLRPHDDDPSGLNDCEFVLTMLLELGCVDRPTLTPLFQKFRALDVNPDGRLSAQDVAMSKQLTPTDLRNLRRGNTVNYNEALSSMQKLSPTPPSILPNSVKTVPAPMVEVQHGALREIAID